MLKRIRVKNFKIIEDSSLLSLNPLTVLIGRNGSGKSSLIEALGWLGQAASDGAESATERFVRITDVLSCWGIDPACTFGITIVLDPRDVSVGEEVYYEIRVGTDPDGQLPQIKHEKLIAKSRDYETELIRTIADRRQYRVIAGSSPTPTVTEVRERKRDRELEILAPTEIKDSWRGVTNPDRLALAELDPIDNRAGALLKRFLERAVFLRLNPHAIASFAPARSKPSPRLLDEEGAGLAELLARLDSDTLSVLIEKISFIIHGAANLETHLPQSPGDRRYFTLHEARSYEGSLLPVPAWVLSEGTRRVTAILAVLLQDNPPPLLCIEEVENGLDPWTLKYLLEELAGAVQRGTQIILTSHSPYLLNLLPLENIIYCDREDSTVKFISLGDMSDLETVQTRMGPGDLYIHKYLDESSKKESL